MRASRARHGLVRRRVLAGAAALAALLGMLSGCTAAAPPGSDPVPATSGAELPALSSVTPAADPRAYEGPSTAIVAPSPLQPLADPRPQLPVTVSSHDRAGDVPVTIGSVQRVLALSLSGNLGDTVYALGLGDRLVGRDVSTSFPGAQALPVVTRDGHALDAESIVALAPDVVVSDGSLGPYDVLLQLRDAGIPVVLVNYATDFAGMYETTRQLGAALGLAAEGAALAAGMQQAVAAKTAEIASWIPEGQRGALRVAFLYVRGSSGIFYLFGQGSGVTDILGATGVDDVAQDIGWAGMKPMTDEAMVALDPDVLLVMTGGLLSAGGVDGLLAAQPSVALTTAGQHRRIVDIDDTLVLSYGPRMPEVLDALARAFYAPQSLPSAD